MKKKSFGLLMIAAVLAGTAGCAPKKENQTFTVGICQFTQHEALDAAAQGFKDALTEKLDGRVAFEEQNANGDFAACTTAVGEMISNEVDLILADSTIALQVAALSETEIPILGTAVTDYAVALQLEDFDGTVGENISGTSDQVPADKQAALIQELFPEARKVGLVYCAFEANSQYQADAMQHALDDLGYACEAYLFADSNDLTYMAEKAAAECDVIYVPTDNTIAASAGLIANVCIPAKVPVIAGEESTCRTCGAATLSVDYYELGYTTGEMAAEILAEGRDISEMPVQYASSFTKKYNEEICEELGITVPDDYVSLKGK